VFDVNFWGVIHGCRAALPHLRARPNGGAIINIGSVLSDVSAPLQGIYSASKHAVKGYTDTLRMEVEADGVPVSISLVKPAAIDTPYTEHSPSRMGVRPTHAPPVYAPEVVARAVLECCERPIREVAVGGSSKMLTLMNKFSPRLADKYLEKTLISGSKDNEPPYDDSHSGLFHPPQSEGETRGHYKGHVMKSSLYTRFSLHPISTGLVALGAGMILRGLIALRKSSSRLSLSHREDPPNDTGAAA
jgi:hypothetical protein